MQVRQIVLVQGTKEEIQRLSLRSWMVGKKGAYAWNKAACNSKDSFELTDRSEAQVLLNILSNPFPEDSQEGREFCNNLYNQIGMIIGAIPEKKGT